MNLCTCLCFRLTSSGKGCVNNYYARKSLGYFWFLSVSCCSFRILFTSVFASICIFMKTNITMCTCKCIPIWALFFNFISKFREIQHFQIVLNDVMGSTFVHGKWIQFSTIYVSILNFSTLTTNNLLVRHSQKAQRGKIFFFNLYIFFKVRKVKKTLNLGNSNSWALCCNYSIQRDTHTHPKRLNRKKTNEQGLLGILPLLAVHSQLSTLCFLPFKHSNFAC